MTEFWNNLGTVKRTAIVVIAVASVVATAGLAYWLLRTDYEVLFGDLTTQDAAAIAAELDRQKVPYRVEEHGSDAGTAILVDRKDVYTTRLKVLGTEVPLRGAVGFELFNNTDFGMTEFAQRINYQRALQGELTRTILSITEVRDARVLLALPEQGLFKRDRAKATASVTLTLRTGRSLTPSQVSGIQRLVAAAVPGISSQDVTIVDQTGVALSRQPDAGEEASGAGRLDLKRDTEVYLTRKASEVLDRVLGAGQALATVDVTLDMDRVQTTTDDVLPAGGHVGQTPAGVVIRERETVREVGGPVTTQASVGVGGGAAGSSQREVEYAVGRKVEQVIGQPGAIRRLQVVAVVRKALDGAQQERLRTSLGASVGAVLERGDQVVVQSIADVATEALPGSVDEEQAPSARSATVVRAESSAIPRTRSLTLVLGGAGLLALLLLLLGASAMLRGRRRDRGAPPALSDAERRAALQQLRDWLGAEPASRGPGNVR